jgi:hypothetical protein
VCIRAIKFLSRPFSNKNVHLKALYGDAPLHSKDNKASVVKFMEER